MIHEHSFAAYHAELPKLSRRAVKVIDWIELHGPSTDRDVMIGMGFTDMNCVRPRITEALDRGALAEVGERKCPVTGKTVRVVTLSLDERGQRQDRRMDACAAQPA